MATNAATVADFKQWLQDDLFVNLPSENKIEVREDNPEKARFRFRIYTETNWYSITAIAPKQGEKVVPDTGYLGCISKSRKPRAGEHWHRGNDMHDGPMTRDTLRRILFEILRYELVTVHRTKVKEEVTPEFFSTKGKARRDFVKTV
jgi:hypothetical protein